MTKLQYYFRYYPTKKAGIKDIGNFMGYARAKFPKKSGLTVKDVDIVRYKQGQYKWRLLYSLKRR